MMPLERYWEQTEADYWTRARDILHFVGVCGAGKTTLSNRLAKRCAASGGTALGTIDWDPHTPDQECAAARAFSRELDQRINATGGRDPVVHREIVDHALALLDGWKHSAANVVLVDRWYESYDHLPNACRGEIEAAISASGFRLRRFLLLVADGAQGDEEGPMRERLLHTKANRPESWWGTGPATLDEWVREECAYQDDYRRFCEVSRFPTMTLRTTAMTWETYEAEIVSALLRARSFDRLVPRHPMTPPTACAFNWLTCSKPGLWPAT